MRLSAPIALGLGGIVLAAAAPAAPVADARAAFERYDAGWRHYDVEAVVAAFAPDFEWTNEVGIHFTDKTQLRRLLRHLFADPKFLAGKPGPLVIRSVRLIAPDVAIVTSSEETKGQRDATTGKVVPIVTTNELTVMKHAKGRWLIVDDLTSDDSHGI
jgi:uncharacterized protein (TIGR02246 family)